MRKFTLIILLIGFVSVGCLYGQQESQSQQVPEGFVPNSRVDNNGYWKRMAKLGLATLNPVVEVKKARYTGSEMRLHGRVMDSPDVAVTSEASTQSENSVFVNPNDPDNILNTNNSTPQSGGSVYGADGLFSFDGGVNWDGSVQGTAGTNQGDPAAAIGHDGTFYNGFIYDNGQAVAVSDDQGATWSRYIVAPGPSGFNSLLDKNHMWIDNAQGPFQGTLYNAWTNFGGSNDNNIEMSISTDKGQSWTPAVNLSQAISTSGHHQGVNISTGPNGEAYVVWTIYDNWPQSENSMGFTRSYDGGGSWEPAWRIIDNINGIRNDGVNKNMRVNSFPTMAVDCSDGPYSGNIYVFWANVGVPGINTGNDIDIYMIKSVDKGTTWADPIRINQDPTGLGKEHYQPWAAVDAVTGAIAVVYYDDRNVSATECETYVSYSIDGGSSWEDMKVSDVAFTPTPIPGLATGYFGDYLALHAHGGKVYPLWTDNRTGTAMTYVSPFTLGVAPDQVVNPSPSNNANQVGVFTKLNWEMGGGFEPTSYKLYFGTDNPPTNIHNGIEISDPTFEFVNLLDYTTEYFWRIDAVNDFGETTGETWKFKTNREPDENFETGNFNDYPWTFGGDVDWVIDDAIAFNGVYSARSGEIGVDQSSSLILEANIEGLMGFVTFHRKTQSVGIFNKMIFLIDGVVKDEWSGNSVWTEESFPVTGGNHTFEWRFEKGEAGQHYAWIDYIYFPPFATLSANAGADADICEGETYQLNGGQFGAVSYLWASDGDGAFDNPEILNPVYTPGNDDIANGNVKLTLTVTDGGGETASDFMMLAINGLPMSAEAVNVDFNDFCAGSVESIVLTAEGGQGETLNWFSGSCGGEAIATGVQVEIMAPSESMTYYAQWSNLCGQSECKEILVNVLQQPTQPAMPEGPVLVLVNQTPVSTYSTETVPLANAYTWMLTPQDAGNIEMNNQEVIITWNEDFIGDAMLSVVAINDCGESEVSEVLEIVVDNNVGISDGTISQLSILPNPNNGQFVVHFSKALSSAHTVRIMDNAGNIIYKNTYTPDLSKQLLIKLDRPANGIYFLGISGPEINISKKLLIKN